MSKINLMTNLTLASLTPNEKGRILSMDTPTEVTHRLVEMGLAPGEIVTFIRKAPLGDPIEIEVMNYRLAIRKSEAENIQLVRVNL